MAERAAPFQGSVYDFPEGSTLRAVDQQDELAAEAWEKAREALRHGQITLKNRDGSDRVMILKENDMLRHVQWLASKSITPRKNLPPPRDVALKRTDGRRPGHPGGGNSP